MGKNRRLFDLMGIGFGDVFGIAPFFFRLLRCNRRSILIAILTIFSLLAPIRFAAAWGIDTSLDNWAVLSGYGQSFPGWGQTTQRVETIDLIPRYNHVIFADLGSDWYRGYHSLLLEVPVSLVVDPDNSAMIGVNFLAAYTFTAGDQWRPYVFGGGGPVYSFADVPGMGADLNGNYQFGAGLRYDWQDDHQLLFEVRYHHISNGGSEEPNDPLNSMKILLGVTF